LEGMAYAKCQALKWGLGEPSWVFYVSKNCKRIYMQGMAVKQWLKEGLRFDENKLKKVKHPLLGEAQVYLSWNQKGLQQLTLSKKGVQRETWFFPNEEGNNKALKKELTFKPAGGKDEVEYHIEYKVDAKSKKIVKEEVTLEIRNQVKGGDLLREIDDRLVTAITDDERTLLTEIEKHEKASPGAFARYGELKFLKGGLEYHKNKPEDVQVKVLPGQIRPDKFGHKVEITSRGEALNIKLGTLIITGPDSANLVVVEDIAAAVKKAQLRVFRWDTNYKKTSTKDFSARVTNIKFINANAQTLRTQASFWNQVRITFPHTEL